MPECHHDVSTLVATIVSSIAAAACNAACKAFENLSVCKVLAILCHAQHLQHVADLVEDLPFEATSAVAEHEAGLQQRLCKIRCCHKMLHEGLALNL